MNTLEFNPRLKPAQVPARPSMPTSHGCTCPRCGGRLVDDATSCLLCGESLPAEVVARLSTKDNSMIWLAAFMCLMIVAATARVMLG